ncbi:alpha/beta hydrolase family protein [Micromonospora auratinigra]|nr:S28 family serine protease [Micromonospora auratinigra]
MVGAMSGAGVANAASSRNDDIKDQLLAIPGMSLIEDKPYPGYRFFILNYTQPVDHRDLSGNTFQQRITVLHKDTNRPTVFYTGGYNVSTNPSRREPTQIVDGNQVSMEYRFFTPSRPDPADWSKLDIWQAASDQHRIFRALKPLYPKNWLASGVSKGGMTATYYERLYPNDMDGVAAYVAPNDVVNDEDSAYDNFFATVGTAECRDRLNGMQREALVRREPLEKLYEAYATENSYSFNYIGDMDRAFEMTVLDYVWSFWQVDTLADCDKIPANATKATDQEIWDSIEELVGFWYYTDQGLVLFQPYFYQAGTQLGAPSPHFPYIEPRLIRYGYQPPRNFVPHGIVMPAFDSGAMRDVDEWVRHRAEHMLFIYGQNDPWGAEPFRLGPGSSDSFVFVAPGANHHLAVIGGLNDSEKSLATAKLLEWAGVAPAAVRADPSKAQRLTTFDDQLDRLNLDRERPTKP